MRFAAKAPFLPLGRVAVEPIEPRLPDVELHTLSLSLCLSFVRATLFFSQA